MATRRRGEVLAPIEVGELTNSPMDAPYMDKLQILHIKMVLTVAAQITLHIMVPIGFEQLAGA
jgi:hypothetical protein